MRWHPAQSPRRGEIVRVRLGPVEGSEQVGERPVLVISPDLINENSPVILVAACTTQKVDRVYPFEALIEAGEGGLKRRSKVLLMQLRAIDKRRIIGACGQIRAETMKKVKDALAVATGLIRI
ncbi:MAG: type II toxin-antitoxin system PemK/MazF family toxin [Candidatus Hydrogenedentes bacterium]|nr:type II toxin-antitoxin system PemK/MazF family toxin [Candidatus Hydrogenedentota bacterium]